MFEPNEKRLLDDLQDARDDMNAYKFRVTMLVVGFIVSFVATIIGACIGTLIPYAGGIAAAICMPAGICVVVCGVTFGIYVTERSDKTRRALRNAERAHRDHLLRNST